MRLGLSSYCYRYAVNDAVSPLDAFTMVENASALGVDFLQICDNLPLEGLSSAELQRLKGTAREKAVAIEVGTRGLDIDHLRRYTSIAHTLGSQALRLVLDTRGPQEARDRLRPLVALLREAELNLAIENHFGLSSQDLVSVIDSLGSDRIRVCLDTANSVGLLERPEETVAALSPFACQVHLKDFAIEKAAIGYHVTGRPLGEGWLKLEPVLGALGSRAAQLDYAVELWMDPEITREATLEKESRWVAQSVGVARKLLDNHLGGQG